MHVGFDWGTLVFGAVGGVTGYILTALLLVLYLRAEEPKDWTDFWSLVHKHLMKGNALAANAVIAKYYRSHPGASKDVLNLKCHSLQPGKNLAFLSLPSQSSLMGMDAFRVDLSFASLPAVDLDGAKLMSSVAHRMTAHGARLRKASLNEAKWTDAMLDGAMMDGAQLGRADLSGAALFGASLRGVSVSETVFKKADLRRSDLTGAEGNGTDFESANLTFAALVNASLPEASFKDANLSGVDARGCNLDGADISGANLEGFMFDEHTHVTGVNPVGAKNVPPVLLERIMSELQKTVNVAPVAKEPDPERGPPQGTPPKAGDDQRKPPRPATASGSAAKQVVAQA